MALKAKNAESRSALADPMGAALYSYYTTGELKSEGTSITEGIGQGRITANLEGAADRPRLPDPRCRGGADRLRPPAARRAVPWRLVGHQRRRRHPPGPRLGPGHTIVTMLCDYGTRYQSKLFNRLSCAKRTCRCRRGWSPAGAGVPEVFVDPEKV